MDFNSDKSVDISIYSTCSYRTPFVYLVGCQTKNNSRAILYCNTINAQFLLVACVFLILHKRAVLWSKTAKRIFSVKLALLLVVLILLFADIVID